MKYPRLTRDQLESIKQQSFEHGISIATAITWFRQGKLHA